MKGAGDIIFRSLPLLQFLQADVKDLRQKSRLCVLVAAPSVFIGLANTLVTSFVVGNKGVKCVWSMGVLGWEEESQSFSSRGDTAYKPCRTSITPPHLPRMIMCNSDHPTDQPHLT